MDLGLLRQRLVDVGAMSGEDVAAQLAQWRAEGGEEDGGVFLDWLVRAGRLTEAQRAALQKGAEPSFRLGPYRLGEQFAAGRLGLFFRGVHDEFRQPVTLKVFPPEDRQGPEQSRRVAQETPSYFNPAA